MWSSQYLLYIFLLLGLFVLLTPGVVLRISKKSTPLETAILHGILFVIVLVISHTLYSRLREGLDNPSVSSISYPDGILTYDEVSKAFKNYVSGKMNDVTINSITTQSESVVFSILFQNIYTQKHGFVSNFDLPEDIRKKLFGIDFYNETNDSSVKSIIGNIPFDRDLAQNIKDRSATEMDVLNGIYLFIASHQLSDDKRNLVLNEIIKMGPNVVIKYLDAIPDQNYTHTDKNGVQTQESYRNLMISQVKQFVSEYHSSAESSINKHALNQNFRNYMTDQIVGLVDEYQKI